MSLYYKEITKKKKKEKKKKLYPILYLLCRIKFSKDH